MKNGIVVLGSCFIDLKGYPIAGFIPTGRNAGRVETVHGGVARNVCEDIANLDLRPTFISLADDDGTGEEVVRRLEKHNVNTKYIKRIKDGMGIWLVVFDAEGDVCASVSKRPDLLPIGDILDQYGDEIFSECDSVALEFDLDEPTVRKCLELAKKYGKEVYALISNMTIALERRSLLADVACFICNQDEAGLFFLEDYSNKTPEEMSEILMEKVTRSKLHRMVVTMGSQGSVYAELNGDHGVVPAMKVKVEDTSGAGDSFFAGVTAGLTYGKTLRSACEIGTRLAASVVATGENVCPHFLPEEFGLETSHN